MPGRRLRGLKADRVVKALEKAGLRVDRVRGSHYILLKEGRPRIAVPMHGDVKVGLLLAMIKLAGLTTSSRRCCD